jgi:hypothetical protein
MSTVFPTSPSNGDTYIPPQIQKLLASNISSYNYFGASVAISSDGKTAVIGAYGNEAAYIFTYSGTTWTEQQILTASDSASFDYFGNSVDISTDGNTVIVGAYQEDTTATDQGAAYVFTRTGSTWTQQAKLRASDADTTDRFGSSVSLSSDGNTALIGAETENTSPNSDNGAAYVFTRSGSTWTQQQKLLASDRASNEKFGTSVSLSADGNIALIGADTEDTSPNTNNGAAYIFTRSEGVWTEQQKLLASDAEASDQFGFSVAISSDGNTAVIGAIQGDTSPNSNNGAAYIFTRSEGVWTEQQKLTASDRASNEFFGWSVSFSSDGNTLAIGAIDEDTSPTSDNGAVYIFTRSSGVWEQKQKLVASDRETNDSFGKSVALSLDGNVVIVGASSEETSSYTLNGAAYIYNFNNIGTRYVYNSTDNRWEVETSTPKKAPTTHLFTSSVSSWAIPTNARAIHAVVIGGGGAGGTGGSGTSVAGGGGGGGGGMSIHTYNLITGYQTTAVITVGAGGTSGTGGTSSFRLADSGSLGTLTADGGTAGGGGGASTGAAGVGGLGMFSGGNGGTGSDVFSISSDAPASATGARGGAAGAGNDTSARSGYSGITTPRVWQTTGGVSPGRGGNGGSSVLTGIGSMGTNGNLYGGGGGGGGAGGTGGTRGSGAQGCVFLTVWYE